jgi:aspartate-semialdehyde dehydrogenase
LAKKANSTKTKTFRLALIGADTLLGRELQEVIEAREPATTITPYAASADGSFSNREGEAVYVQALSAKAIAEEDAVVLAGSEEGAAKAFGFAKKSARHPVLIDCNGHLEDQPEAHIIAPLLEPFQTGASRLLVLAHPAATMIAVVLARLARSGRLQQANVQVFEPASERGKHGIAELHQQTTSLLAFKPLERDVFDAQLSFNMLAQYGENAPAKLSTGEQRIERHLASLLSKQVHDGTIPMPSLRLVQAPVFHGYSASMWIQFQSAVEVSGIAEALASPQIDVRGEHEDAPTSVGATGQSGIAAGDIRIDRNNPRAAWLWTVGDNLRLIADGAIDVLAAARKPVQ